MNDKKETSPLGGAAGIAGAIGGFALSRYCGAAIWIPGIAMALLGLLFSKTSVRPKYFPAAIAVTGGHVVWFLSAAVLVGVWGAVVLDVIALVAGIAWLWARPGMGAAIFLGVVQAVSLAINLYTLSDVEISSVAHRALTAHCVLRLLAIGCLIGGYLRMRKMEAELDEIREAADEA